MFLSLCFQIVLCSTTATLVSAQVNDTIDNLEITKDDDPSADMGEVLDSFELRHGEYLNCFSPHSNFSNWWKVNGKLFNSTYISIESPGVYECISKGKGENQLVNKLNVTTVVQDLYFQEFSDVTLNCTNLPCDTHNSSSHWRRWSHSRDNESAHHSDSEKNLPILSISNVSLSDSGVYTCTCHSQGSFQNGTFVSNFTNYLSIVHKVTVVSVKKDLPSYPDQRRPQTLYALEGSKVQLTCNRNLSSQESTYNGTLEGNKIISWYYSNDTKIEGANSNVLEMIPKQSTVYKCVSLNRQLPLISKSNGTFELSIAKLSQVVSKFVVFVVEKTRLKGSNSSMNDLVAIVAKWDSTVKLPCEIVDIDENHNEIVSVEWSKLDPKTGKVVEGGIDNFDFGMDGALHITHVKPKYSGTFVCDVQTKFDNVSLHVELDVWGGPPKIKSDFATNKTVFQFENLTISCESSYEDDIPVNVSWHANDGRGVLQNSSVLVLVNLEESCEYTCVIENEFGIDKKSIHIFVIENTVDWRPVYELQNIQQNKHTQVTLKAFKDESLPKHVKSLTWSVNGLTAPKFRDNTKMNFALSDQDQHNVSISVGTFSGEGTSKQRNKSTVIRVDNNSFASTEKDLSNGIILRCIKIKGFDNRSTNHFELSENFNNTFDYQILEHTYLQFLAVKREAFSYEVTELQEIGEASCISTIQELTVIKHFEVSSTEFICRTLLLLSNGSNILNIEKVDRSSDNSSTIFMFLSPMSIFILNQCDELLKSANVFINLKNKNDTLIENLKKEKGGLDLSTTEPIVFSLSESQYSIISFHLVLHAFVVSHDIHLFSPLKELGPLNFKFRDDLTFDDNENSSVVGGFIIGLMLCLTALCCAISGWIYSKKRKFNGVNGMRTSVEYLDDLSCSSCFKRKRTKLAYDDYIAAPVQIEQHSLRLNSAKPTIGHHRKRRIPHIKMKSIFRNRGNQKIPNVNKFPLSATANGVAKHEEKLLVKKTGLSLMNAPPPSSRTPPSEIDDERIDYAIKHLRHPNIVIRRPPAINSKVNRVGSARSGRNYSPVLNNRANADNRITGLANTNYRPVSMQIVPSSSKPKVNPSSPLTPKMCVNISNHPKHLNWNRESIDSKSSDLTNSVGTALSSIHISDATIRIGDDEHSKKSSQECFVIATPGVETPFDGRKQIIPNHCSPSVDFTNIICSSDLKPKKEEKEKNNHSISSSWSSLFDVNHDN